MSHQRLEAFVTDDTQTKNISFANPVAQIESYSAPTYAAPGSQVQFSFTVRNTGSIGGYVWFRLVDYDTNEEIVPLLVFPLGPGGVSSPFNYTELMPGRNWNVVLEVGHYFE